MQLVLAIAAGGALGAVSRHFVSGAVSKMVGIGFPFGTFSVNILGSLLMGLLVTLFAHKVDVSTDLRSFLTVGFLGSFTTFSTYSMETVLLVQRGDWTGAVFYSVGSLIIGALALVIGLWLGRLFV